MMVKVKNTGSFSKTFNFANRLVKMDVRTVLKKYGDQGVRALSSATPIDSGETSNSWYYQIDGTDGNYTLSFYNTHVEHYANIAILIQYGHATKNGGWVQGRDYINPAIQPIFDKITNEIWKEISR